MMAFNSFSFNDSLTLCSIVLLSIASVLCGMSIYAPIYFLWVPVFGALSVAFYVIVIIDERSQKENIRKFGCPDPVLYRIEKILHINQGFPHPSELETMGAFRNEYGFEFIIDANVVVDAPTRPLPGHLHFKYDIPTNTVLVLMAAHYQHERKHWACMSFDEMCMLFVRYYVKLHTVPSTCPDDTRLPKLHINTGALVYNTGKRGESYQLISAEHLPPISTEVHLKKASNGYILSYAKEGINYYVTLPAMSYSAAQYIACYLTNRR